jgi:hypothetical protein
MAKNKPSKSGQTGSAVSPVSVSPQGGQAPPPGLAASAGAPKIDAVDLSPPEEEDINQQGDRASSEEASKLNDVLRKEQDAAFKKQGELNRSAADAESERAKALSSLKINTPLFGTLR